MSRTDWKYLIDTLLFVCFLGIVLIGLLLGLVIPKGPAVAESSKYFLGLHRHQWGNIHFYLALTFISLVIIHLILSWSWIKGKASQLFKRTWPWALVTTVVIGLLVVVAFWRLYPRSYASYENYGQGKGRRGVVSSSDEYLPSPQVEKKSEEIDSPAKKITSVSQKEIRSPQPVEERKVELSAERLSAHEAELEALQITGQMTLAEVELRLGVSANKIRERLGLPPNVPLNERLGRLRRRYGFTLQELREIVLALIKESQSKK